jgi:hypothetical protein
LSKFQSTFKKEEKFGNNQEIVKVGDFTEYNDDTISKDQLFSNVKGAVSQSNFTMTIFENVIEENQMSSSKKNLDNKPKHNELNLKSLVISGVGNGLISSRSKQEEKTERTMINQLKKRSSSEKKKKEKPEESFDLPRKIEIEKENSLEVSLEEHMKLEIELEKPLKMYKSRKSKKNRKKAYLELDKYSLDLLEESKN